MSELYDLGLVRHSKEEKPQLKSFVNLDGKKIGIEINWELGSLRFFTYDKKKKNQLQKSRWVALNQNQQTIYQALADMIFEYYKEAGRLDAKGRLPMYTQIELKVPVSHIHFHINAGTLKEILDKEVIYN